MSVLSTSKPRILVLQLKRIGDLLLTTPVLRALKEAFPNGHVTVLAEASSKGLLAGLPADRAIARGQNGFWGVAWGAWDVCLDFTGTDRSALLAFMSRATVRATYKRFEKKWPRSWIYTDFVDSSVRERHTADHHTDLLKALDISRENVPLDLVIPEEERLGIGAMVPTAPYAVIHAGTARPEKYWLPDRWAQIAETLHEKGLEIVLTGSKDPEETAHLAAITAALPEKIRVTNLAGKTGLLGLAEVIRRAKIFCGVDTAAMHMADAMGTPCLALFGPTNPFHWQPRHAPRRILRSHTQPPFLPGQKGGSMEALTAEEVASALTTLLQSPFGRA